ncbi:MAG: gliding motility-associated C-terminal domain-containing protein [Saprospiraceae bacterium]|nr:gliding motility-associated C-terminal domain-containing protein [Saprospiraceae bacterium]
MRLIILLVICCQTLDSQSQSCSGNLGENIFTNGDFGRGTANILTPDPKIAPGYIYGSFTPPPDGVYLITNNSDWSNKYPTWIGIKDNSPDPDGYMMVINASYTPGIFYEQTVTGLCENTLYAFSADVINMVRTVITDHTFPNVSFLLDDVVKYNTGDIPQSEKWNTAGFTFTTKPGQFSLKLTLRNNAPGGNGNDLAIDNISFRACGPQALILPEKTENICEDGNPITLNATIEGSQYPNPAIQWQISQNGQNDWTNVGQNVSFRHTNLKAGYYYYRYLLAATPQNLVNSKCRIISNTKVIFVQPKFYNYADTICDGMVYTFGKKTYTRTGIYVDSLQSSIGCDSIITLRLEVIPDNKIMIDRTVTSPSCQKKSDGSVSINNIYKGYPPYTSFLNNLAPVNNNFNNLSDGTYVLKVIDRYGCNLKDTIQLVEPPPYLVDLGDDLHLILGQEVILHASSTLPTVSGQFWFEGQVICDLSCDGDPYIPYKTSTLKWVARSERGCLASDSIQVIVDNVVKTFAPNIFTPNGDGINDYFLPLTNKNIVKGISSFMIFDRFGGVVYEAKNLFPNDLTQGWDGTRHGLPADQGIYLYKVDIVLINDETVNLAGDILLLR